MKYLIFMISIFFHNPYVLCGFIFFLIIRLPDLFLPRIISKHRRQLSRLGKHEEWREFSQILGWVERALYGVFIIFLQQQFIAFVGIWMALKAVGSFNTWQPSFQNSRHFEIEKMFSNTDEHQETDKEYQRRRANYMIFTIGTGVSLLWVIVVYLFFKGFNVL